MDYCKKVIINRKCHFSVFLCAEKACSLCVLTIIARRPEDRIEKGLKIYKMLKLLKCYKCNTTASASQVGLFLLS
jgi:hypothetical protein